MRVFVSAGEASGDAFGAAILERMAIQSSDTIEAVGGPALRAAGADLIADSSTWGAMGIIESLKVVPRALLGRRAALARLRRGAPGLFIPIDFGFFNVRLARSAKTLGWRVLYFIPPGSWRRDRQAADLKQIADAVVTPFPWSAELLQAQGVDARFYGHPLKQALSATVSPKDRDAVAVLPGSRRHEIEHNLPIMAKALKGIGRPVLIAAARTTNEEQLLRDWSAAGGPVAEVVDGSAAALRRSRAALVCSGTATLEAALLRCPCVVMYRVSPTMYTEFKLLRPKFEYISLPNIILRRGLLPELLQHDASPERLRAELDSLLADGPARNGQLEGFEELDTLLGPEDCLDRTAAHASEMAR